MIRNLGVILSLLAFLLVAGCGQPIIGPYSTRQEVKLGQQVASEVEKQSKLDTDPADVARIQSIAGPVLEQAKSMRGDINYQVKIIQSKEVNAFSLPGGWIYLYTGLIEKAGGDDDAIACVIGHEAAHCVRRHAIKQLQDAQKQGILIDLVGILSRSDSAYQAVSLASDLDQLHYSREDEYEADKYGLMFAYNAGYDPYGMPRFFQVIERLEKAGDNSMPWSNDHPITRNRIARVYDLIDELRANHGAYPVDARKQ